jgi:hypothetical protein
VVAGRRATGPRAGEPDSDDERAGVQAPVEVSAASSSMTIAERRAAAKAAAAEGAADPSTPATDGSEH